MIIIINGVIKDHLLLVEACRDASVEVGVCKHYDSRMSVTRNAVSFVLR